MGLSLLGSLRSSDSGQMAVTRKLYFIMNARNITLIYSVSGPWISKGNLL